MFAQENQETNYTKMFNELFSELEYCNEDEQRKKIEEMNEIINEMNKEEFFYVFTARIFNKIDKMIEEEKLSLEKCILFLKHVRDCNFMKTIFKFYFRYSSLDKRIEEMIIDESEKKKEEKNEKLLDNLCKCYISLSYNFPPELLSICVTCLLKAALNKVESEENQKEVEIALLALSNTNYYEIDKELYLNEIKEIIKYHLEHHNLTHLAYQSAWQFLIYRFIEDKSLEGMIVNELHFTREAGREFEDLTRSVDWKKEKKAKEDIIIERWLQVLDCYFYYCQLRNEEYVGLISSIVRVLRAARENKKEINYQSICSLRNAAEIIDVKINDLLKSEAVDAVLEEIQQPTIVDEITKDLLLFSKYVSMRLKEEEDDEKEEMKRKEAKRKVLEKMEEEGFEDLITSFHNLFDFLNKKYYFDKLSLDISDYFVKI
ncbi:uncharacterized protein MONOS_18522 [Monocercomonoides exilis]|uniref:uncharacterized protein n=1 Tax=Monocercomonoides exilis TaxID=2049356 RepID=UPI0035597AEC|nr:hypothetical protein MONOS_18522 [Monocercomonoides exilis]